MQITAGMDQAQVARGVPPPVVDPLTPSLSERASQHLRDRQPIRRESWKETHLVDASMRAVYASAALRVEDANRSLNGNSYKVNAVLTINVGALARQGETPQQVLRRLTRNMRNLFRGLAHRFAGFWRLEIGSPRYGGWHYHLVFHAPRGMRAALMNALPIWTGEPLDVSRSSKSFSKSKWRVYGSEGAGSWRGSMTSQDSSITLQKFQWGRMVNRLIASTVLKRQRDGSVNTGLSGLTGKQHYSQVGILSENSGLHLVIGKVARLSAWVL